jgi:hypothetical protein
MRIMRMHEALGACGGKNLFCSDLGLTKQIFIRGFWHFCLILPHMPHELRIVTQHFAKNMRLMKVYEDRVFKGFHLFCIYKGVAAGQNMRIGIEKYEAHPHVLGEAGRYFHLYLLILLLIAFSLEVSHE